MKVSTRGQFGGLGYRQIPGQLREPRPSLLASTPMFPSGTSGSKDITARLIDTTRDAIVISAAVFAVAGPLCAVLLLGGTSMEIVDSNVLTISPETAAAWQKLRSPSVAEAADLKPKSVAAPDDQLPLAATSAAGAPDRRVLLMPNLDEATTGAVHGERNEILHATLSESGPPLEPPMALNGPKVKFDVPAPGQSGETLPPPASDPQITLVLKADLGAQQLTVLENDTVVHTWPISSGMDGYPTPTGSFQPKSANRMWYSRQYNWTPMPYAVFFSRGVAFHGTDATSRLGTSASHGCIRLATSNAAELFDLVHKHGFDRTSIIVLGTPKHDGAAVVRRVPSVARESLRAVTRRAIPQSNNLPSWLGSAFNP